MFIRFLEFDCPLKAGESQYPNVITPIIKNSLIIINKNEVGVEAKQVGYKHKGYDTFGESFIRRDHGEG